MTDATEFECYLIPAFPLPILLPVECVADITEKPMIEAMKGAPAPWMAGHTNWHNQRLPVMSFSALQDLNIDESKKRKPHLVVLNPIPDAARKAYSGMICYGDIKTVSVDQSLEYAEVPASVDRRYIDAVVNYSGQDCIVPRLSAMGVAFSYF